MGHLREQVELWEHARRGKVWRGQKIVFENDPVTGRRVARTVRRQPRRWFERDPSTGTYRVRCYYRHTPVVLRPPDGTDVVCERFDQVGEALAILLEATRMGELDEALRLAARG